MKVDVIDSFAAFEALRPNWNSVYAADPDANIFLSWDWMSKWLRDGDPEWLILAARQNATAREYVSFFPLRVNTRPAKGGGFFTEIGMGGGNVADYTGFIVRPTCADAVIDAFARAIKKVNWAVARFSRMRVNEEYHNRLIRWFPSTKFDVLLDYPMKDSAGIDNSICPYVTLPGTWEQYLSNLSANTRQQLRRLLRKVDSEPDLRITHASSADIDRAITILIELWTQKWNERKGHRIPDLQRMLRAQLRDYYDLGILYMPILWRGDTPLGVNANLIDGEKRVMHFLIAGRDENCSNPQPGLALHAHSIRHAIEMGLTRYDFLRGNERYKYSFGSMERRISNTIVRTKPGAAQGRVLDVRSIPRALHLIKELKSAGKWPEVEAGYRQILGLDPDCTPAILGYAELKVAQGRMMFAEKLLRDLVVKHNSSEAAWLALGQCLAAQHCWPEAEACYCRALELNPRLAAAHYQLGLMHEAKGHAAEAQRSYKKVLEIDPDYGDVKRRLIDVVLRPAQRRTSVVDPSKADTP